jgi:hypothetical protein
MIANNLRTALGTRGTQTLSSIAKRSSSSSQNSSGLCSLVFSLQEPIFLKGWWGSVLRWNFARFAYVLEPPRAFLFATFLGGLYYDGMRGVCHSWDTHTSAYIWL